MPQEFENALIKNNIDFWISDKIERLYGLEKKYNIELISPTLGRNIPKFEKKLNRSIFNTLSRMICYLHQQFYLIGRVIALKQN